jgi:MoaA/NifB/PqqE/SkfB family radical SAM enzyme
MSRQLPVIGERAAAVPAGKPPSWLQRVLDRAVSPLLSRALWLAQLKQEVFPGLLAIEVTSLCNLRCPMCPRTFSTRKFGHMALPTVQRLIDEIAPYDARGLVEQVALQGYGEIFLHPDWFAIVEHACARLGRAHIRVDTNATVMRPPVVDRLFSSRLKAITISVDGVDERTYRVLRTGGAFQQVVDNIQYFIDRRRREPDRGPAASIQIIESDFTRPYLADFVAAWQARIGDASRVRVSVIPYHSFAGSIQDERFETPRRAGLYVRVPCYRTTYELQVHSDGVATLCCFDSERTLAVGNVHEATLAEIWRGPEARRYRDEMRRGRYARLPLCATCPHSQKFLAHYARAAGLARAWAGLARDVRRWRRARLFR